VIARYRSLDIPKFFRGDAAFAGPKLLRLLELEGFRYAIRIKSNAVLERKITHLLRRPVGRPSHKPKVFYHSFCYRAGSWDQARRVVAKVEWHAGELFPRVGFIVTNLTWRAKKVVRSLPLTMENGIPFARLISCSHGSGTAATSSGSAAHRLQVFQKAVAPVRAPARERLCPRPGA
jgi:Transposase DDE domain group 1